MLFGIPSAPQAPRDERPPAGRRPEPAYQNERLPTEHELVPHERVLLEKARLGNLLKQLKALKTPSASAQPTVPAMTAENENVRHNHLQRFHFEMLKYLTSLGRDVGLAYQLGRSLRDTADPPTRPVGGASTTPTNHQHKVALTLQLDPGRLAKLQGWLATLQASLPDNSAPIVSASMGQWSELVGVLFDTDSRRETEYEHEYDRERPSHSSKHDIATILDALLFQGDAWLNLLIGAKLSSGLLTPESQIAAGEAALSRTAKLIRRVLVHYWFALLVMVLALAGIVFFAWSDLKGAPRFVTSTVAVAGGFGITAKGIASSIVSLGKKMESPIYAAATIDAAAWSITTFPTSLSLNKSELRSLRRSSAKKSRAVMMALQN